MLNKKSDFQICLNDMIFSAKNAGKILLQYQKKISKLTISHKEAQGVVSQADVSSENSIIKYLSKRYSESSFLAEESSYNVKIESESKIEWQWIIDPLDGTANFLNGLDYFAVCIALAHFGTPVLAVVYRPATEELFYSINGKSYCEKGAKKKRLQLTSLNKKLSDSMLVTGFVSEKGVFCQQEFKIFESVLPQARGIRRFGSAALDICYVASGIYDGFWERELCPWDVAAAGLIAINAGAKVTDWHKNEFSPFQTTIIATKKTIYKSLIGLINSTIDLI